jgi:predicted permease
VLSASLSTRRLGINYMSIHVELVMDNANSQLYSINIPCLLILLKTMLYKFSKLQRS